MHRRPFRKGAHFDSFFVYANTSIGSSFIAVFFSSGAKKLSAIAIAIAIVICNAQMQMVTDLVQRCGWIQVA